jgi:predicted nucleotidyltransferase component of viral defense system
MIDDKKVSGREMYKFLSDSASKLSKERGEPIDTVRKKIAFDFAIMRLMTNGKGTYVVKGGYAIELKFGVMRSTKDLDIVTKKMIDASLTGDYESISEKIRIDLVDALGTTIGDDDRHIRFKTAEKISSIKGGGGGVQVSVRMMVGDQRFTEFSMDITVEDIKNPSREQIEFKTIIPSLSAKTTGDIIANEQIFAEKLHAYMRHSEEHQARAKDLIDLVLLAQKELDFALCRRLIEDVFSYWHETGAERGLKSLPSPPASAPELSPPPASWENTYKRMAQEMRLDLSMEEGFRRVASTVKVIFEAA